LIALLVAVSAGAAPAFGDAIAIGDCAGAHRAPTPSQSTTRQAEARALAIGWCELRAASPIGALEALQQVTSDSDLSPYASLLRARALLALGRADEALTAIDGATAPGSAGDEIRLLRGRVLAGRGDPAGRRDLTSLYGGPLEPQARFWAAEAAGVHGDHSGLLEGLYTVWIDARPGGWDERAAVRLVELGESLHDVSTESGRARAAARLTKLHGHHRVAEALALAPSLQGDAEPTDRAGWLERAAIHFSGRDYPAALAAQQRALGDPAEVAGEPDELFEYALTAARTGDFDTAAVIYRRLIEAHPDTKQAEFSSFKLGYMKFDRNECTEALPLFSTHRERFPGGRHIDEALWFAARCEWRAGNTDAATALYGALRAARPRSSLVPGAAYWQARALGLDGDTEAETDALEAVLVRWPSSAYAWFSAKRLERTFPARAPAVVPPWPSAWKAKGAVHRAEALLDAGLRSWGLAELRTLKSDGRPGTALPLAWALLRAGDYRGAKRLACPHAAPAWKLGDPAAQQACTPRPERPLVEAQSRDSGLDPSVVYAVMVAESAMQPGVASAAGARGLMQLMPPVGGRLHNEAFPNRDYDAEDLYLGPYNAFLGTMELAQLTERLQGTLVPDATPAVIGSYNAGIEAVQRWVNASESPAFDEWSEDVGYTETRKYIKRVLGQVMAYRWLYGDG